VRWLWYADPQGQPRQVKPIFYSVLIRAAEQRISANPLGVSKLFSFRSPITKVIGEYPIIIFSSLLTLVFILFPKIIIDFDSRYYLNIASGNLKNEHAPYTSRALIPLIVEALNKYANVSLEHGFMIVAIIAASAFVFSLKQIARLEGYSPAPILIFVASTFFAIQTFAVAAMPDAACAAVTALCFAALRDNRFIASAILTAIAVAVRESSIILLLFMLWYFGSLREWRLMILTAILGLAGYRLTAFFASAGLANIHEMNAALYMVLKIPVNFLTQVVGVPLWTDSMAWCSPPVLTYKLPSFLPTGRLHEIGICGWSPGIPIRNLATLMTVFGTMPAMLLAAKGAKGDHWIALVATYGAVMTGLGLCTGWSVARLISSGWPLFVLTLPVLWQRLFKKDLPLALLPLHLAALAICLGFRLSEKPLSTSLELTALCAAMCCQIGTFVMARRASKPS
jgi:hypothetical protein